MKKKFITLFLAVVFILCNATVAFAAGGTKTGAEAVAASKDANAGVLIVDVRTKANYDKGHLEGSLSYPLFGANGVDDTLKSNFTQYVNDNKATFEGKDIYILCNSGNKGAIAGTEALITAGISEANIFTITGGATDADVKAAFVIDRYYVTGAEAVTASKDANSGVLIVDVRTKANYDKGHLKGSLSYPLFGANGVDETLKSNFTKYINENKATFDGKNIYILCNSGKSGAIAGTEALLAADIPAEKIFTITDGAAGADVKAALTYVSADQAISVIDNKDYLILDVRTAENYAKGHLNGSLSYPLFGANGVDATLKSNLTQYVKDNKATFENKTIYILCNSGNSGAVAGTEALIAAGIPADKIFTIEGGATNASIQAKYVSDGATTEATPAPAPTPESTTPKTGDAASSMMYVMLMVVALGAVVVINKKRVVK